MTEGFASDSQQPARGAEVEHAEVESSAAPTSASTIEAATESVESLSTISSLREGGKDPILNATIRELIYHSSIFIVYLDEKLRVQYRGQWRFPAGSEDICFELARLESLTLGRQSFFGMKSDEEQLMGMRRLIGEVFAKLHGAPDVVRAQACLTKADQVISGVVTDNTRLKRVIASTLIAAVTGLIGWSWINFQNRLPGINPDNEFGLWIPLGSIGALLFSFTRMHQMEVRPFSSNWLIFWESSARILAGAIGALLLIAAAKANLLLGVLSQATTNTNAFWGFVVLSILAGASERIVPDFVTRMDGSGSGTAPSSAIPSATINSPRATSASSLPPNSVSASNPNPQNTQPSQKS